MSALAEKGAIRGPARVVAAGAVVAMVAATVAIAIWIISVKNTPPEAPSTPMKRIPVETVVVRHETFTHQMHVLGTVTPIRAASVASQVVGPIVAIPEGVELGAPIEKGQLLAQIKPTSYEIAHQEAEALLAQRRAAYQEQRSESEKRTVVFKIAEENVGIVKAEADRIENLFKEEVVSHSENDAARGRLTQARIEYERLRSEYRSADAALSRVAAEIAQAEARLAGAKEDLANTRITAPFAGLIAKKVAEVGDHVAVGQTIVRLVDIARVKILINVPSEDIHALRPGSPAEVTVAPFPDRPLRGMVAHVGFEGEVTNRTFPVEVIVDNPPGLPLRAGMFAKVRVAVRTYEEIILVDRRLIQRGPDGPILFVADKEEQLARARPIRLGRLFGERYQVLRGLAPGDVLITEGVELLSDGAPITLPAAANAVTN